MPLVRCTVRNEYGLGVSELYEEANREDPKAVLDGVAVSGLVGILRQLGDLAEFAAEVFHGLQEQVMTTASRSHKLMVRVQGIEAALPPLEKAVLSQTSHLHFCYTAGSEWHPHIQNESNHFVYSDLPQFIMDSYEECRDPPRFHLLDKFDTGGPGSCLKRYSDPTFFKRVSVKSDEVNAGRRRDRTARKRKEQKKRSWQKNGEVSHCASLLNGSGRMQFTAPHEYEPSSPAQTVSYTDMTFKSDMEDQSHSIDSRNDSGYIDCVLHPRSSVQLDKQEPTESSSSQLNMQDNDNLDSLNLDNSRADYDADDFSCISVLEEAPPSTSCVTWDEKTEIVEPEDPNCSEATNILPTDYCQNKQELATNTTNIDQANISLAVDHTQLIAGSQLDEMESETDNFMDALNTIESESGNDMDCQTKREVEHQSSNLNNSVIEDGIHEIMTCGSNHHPSTFESHTASVSSPNKEMSMNILNPVLLDRFTDDDFPQIASLASNLYRLPGKDISDHNHILEGSMSEALTSDLSSSGSRFSQEDPASESVIKSLGVPDRADFCGVQTVQFWTNGGLLGLQPSKPPDYSVQNALNQNLISESKISASPSGHRADKDEPSLLIPKVELPLLPEFKMTSTNTIQENDQVFGIGRRLLMNGFRKPLSHLHDEKFEASNYLKSGTYDNSNTLPDIIFKEQSVKGSSPPLELMKISFQPTNGFETSKLRLKFPDGTHNQEFNSDMFPSFQLVPELSTPMHEDNSESDGDDTFCRSSPISDYCLSHHSHSNSEQWDSIGSPESKEHDLHDAVSCRMSSMESISSALELEGALHRNSHIENTAKRLNAKNGAEPLHYHPLFEHTSYDDVKSSPQQQIPFNSGPVSNGVDHTPSSPPLPPLQWRISKSLSNVTEEDKQDIVSDGLISQAFDMKPLLSAVPLEQPKPVSIEHQKIIAAASSVSTIKSKQKYNGQNTGDQAANGTRLDEKDNFLQQIRDKSFNLRRTLTAKPTLSSAPATHVKVTAILEKAIAIRQVVGSDDGEDDDSWSDA